MKQNKSKENFIKDKILERNNLIENYIVNYLSNKNENEIPYINKKIDKPPIFKKIKKISNSRPKISRVHPKEKSKGNNSISYAYNYINNITNNNMNNADSEDALTIATKKTMASINQQKDNKENKENININSSYTTNTQNSNNSVNKHFSFLNKKVKNKYIINNQAKCNADYFSRKIPQITKKYTKKEFNSFYSLKNNNTLKNKSRSNNRSYAKLNINITTDNTINNIPNYRKTNFNNSFNNKYQITSSKDDFINQEKSKTIDADKTIRKIKKKTLYIINSKSISDNYIYNKKNNYSSFSHDKIEKSQNLNDNSNNKENYEKMFLREVNLEDFLLIIQKFENIKSLINLLPEKIKDIKELKTIMDSIKIKLFDLFRFYFGCAFEGAPENLFFSKRAKINLHYYSIVLILSLGLIYIIINKVKMTQEYFPQIINLFNFQLKLFLLLSDMVIHKIKINDEQKIWVREIMNILNNKLMFNTENYILEMKKIIVNSYYLMNEILVELKFKNESGKIDFNEQEVFYMNFFLRNNLNSLFKYNMNYIEELFNHNIFIFNIISLNQNSNNNYYNEVLDIVIPRQEKNEKRRMPNIPYLLFPPKKQFTLILDLDETLINFKLLNPSKGVGKLTLRPGLINFLEIIKEFYEIIIFTSGTKEYADTILNAIDKKGNNKYFDARLYRDHNIEIGQKYYKDLTKIGRDLSRTIIVDNFNYCFKLQKENGILISSFYGENKEDKALIELQKILIKIYNEKCDVRKSIIKYKEEIFRKISYFNKNQI